MFSDSNCSMCAEYETAKFKTNGCLSGYYNTPADQIRLRLSTSQSTDNLPRINEIYKDKDRVFANVPLSNCLANGIRKRIQPSAEVTDCAVQTNAEVTNQIKAQKATFLEAPLSFNEVCKDNVPVSFTFSDLLVRQSPTRCDINHKNYTLSTSDSSDVPVISTTPLFSDITTASMTNAKDFTVEDDLNHLKSLPKLKGTMLPRSHQPKEVMKAENERKEGRKITKHVSQSEKIMCRIKSQSLAFDRSIIDEEKQHSNKETDDTFLTMSRDRIKCLIAHETGISKQTKGQNNHLTKGKLHSTPTSSPYLEYCKRKRALLQSTQNNLFREDACRVLTDTCLSNVEGCVSKDNMGQFPISPINRRQEYLHRMSKRRKTTKDTDGGRQKQDELESESLCVKTCQLPLLQPPASKSASSDENKGKLNVKETRKNICNNIVLRKGSSLDMTLCGEIQ